LSVKELYCYIDVFFTKKFPVFLILLNYSLIQKVMCMMNNSIQPNFRGLSGFYKKNNRKYSFAIKKPESALEVVKGENGKYTLTFYKRSSFENKTSKVIKDVQDLEIDEITERSGIIVDSDKTFNMKNIIGEDVFVELGKKAKIIVDKMENATVIIQNNILNNDKRAEIRDAKNIIIHNSHSDNQVNIDAKDLILSNSNVNERISLKARFINAIFNSEKFDMLM